MKPRFNESHHEDDPEDDPLAFYKSCASILFALAMLLFPPLVRESLSWSLVAIPWLYYWAHVKSISSKEGGGDDEEEEVSDQPNDEVDKPPSPQGLFGQLPDLRRSASHDDNVSLTSVLG